ncbi:MAG: glycosyltransferase [Candidatus Paceibacterota bacterium]|jgi:glycosyltransferase involved in cell wall biosynthesis
MKILQIGTADKSGGAALISWAIKKAMEKIGNKVSMFVGVKFSDDPNVFLIKRRIFYKYYRYLCYLLSNDIDLFKTGWITKTKPFKEADIVHFHNIHGWFFNLKTFQKISTLKPTVWTLHDEWAITPYCAYAFDGELKNGFYQCNDLNIYPRMFWHNEKYLMHRKKKLYNNSNVTLVVPSMWLKNKVEKSVLKDKKIHLIYNGIDINIFKKTEKNEARKKLGITVDKKIILFVSDGGENNPFKGWVHVEKVLEKYKNDSSVHFLCIGGNSDKKNSIGSNITYVPKIKDPSLLAKYYSSADVFLYPSLADSFGLVVAEAMSCGTPVVTFETGGIPEIVDHEKNGYVAKYRDQEDLENGLKYILGKSDYDLLSMSNNAIDKIKDNFTEEIMTRNYLRLYESLIDNKNNKL